MVPVFCLLELNFKNRADSRMIHSIDLHAATGPGGGAVMTQAPPGETKSFRFKALNPGLYVYHCATPMVANTAGAVCPGVRKSA